MELLSLLANPWFVAPWYVVGALGAAWVIYDVRTVNTPLKTAMKWAWPIIVLFFSVLGLALYFATARAPGVADATDDEAKKRAHHDYEKSMLRRVNGAVIHCVAGDGLGIMTAMVIARATKMSFWQEFWFEYAVGFGFGWFIFQLKSMTMMTDSTPKALAMAFRAEFFSMLTVMGGMGAVMTFVTPAVVGAQPSPLTWAFWGFGMLGLVIGFLFTFPMNCMLVKIGGKHGMGAKEDAHPAEHAPARAALFSAMAVLGAAALVLPAWLTEVREAATCPNAHVASDAASAAPPAAAGRALADGTKESLAAAQGALREGDRMRATRALDDLRRIAMVGADAAPSAFAPVRDAIERARRALQVDDTTACVRHLEDAAGALRSPQAMEPKRTADVARYAGATVIDPRGDIVGEVVDTSPSKITVALGGARDVWGIVDLSRRDRVDVDPSELVFGRDRAVGMRLVTLRRPILCAAAPPS